MTRRPETTAPDADRRITRDQLERLHDSNQRLAERARVLEAQRNHARAELQLTRDALRRTRAELIHHSRGDR